MKSLRYTLLDYISSANEKGQTASISNILDFMKQPKRGSIDTTLNFLLKNKYVRVIGPKRQYAYVVTEKGLTFLKRQGILKDIRQIELELHKMGSYNY